MGPAAAARVSVISGANRSMRTRAAARDADLRAVVGLHHAVPRHLHSPPVGVKLRPGSVPSSDLQIARALHVDGAVGVVGPVGDESTWPVKRASVACTRAVCTTPRYNTWPSALLHDARELHAVDQPVAVNVVVCALVVMGSNRAQAARGAIPE